MWASPQSPNRRVLSYVNASDLAVSGVQQRVQVLQGCWGFVFESSQQAALDGSELDSPLWQQVLVLLSINAQLTHTHTCRETGLPGRLIGDTRLFLYGEFTVFNVQIVMCVTCLWPYLEVVVYRQEVLLQWEWSTEAFLEVFDSPFGEMTVESLDQLLHH